VAFHRLVADHQGGGDLLRRMPFGDQLDHLLLAGGQYGAWRALAATHPVQEVADQGAGDARVEERLPPRIAVRQADTRSSSAADLRTYPQAPALRAEKKYRSLSCMDSIKVCTDGARRLISRAAWRPVIYSIVVNSERALVFFMRTGGNAVVAKSIFTKWFDKMLEPTECVPSRFGEGVRSLAAATPAQLQHAPSRKVRMEVLKRDRPG
jgi:hypothetical protein